MADTLLFIVLSVLFTCAIVIGDIILLLVRRVSCCVT